MEYIEKTKRVNSMFLLVKTSEVVKFLDVQNFKNVSTALQNTKISNISFESAINLKL